MQGPESDDQPWYADLHPYQIIREPRVEAQLQFFHAPTPSAITRPCYPRCNTVASRIRARTRSPVPNPSVNFP
jgi:hypothetical protein